ncbi:MAG TPA: GTP-binding protein [Bacteroidales bacterium]|nr:GTP-binding protein [Bacteroidales bacterium]
MTGITRLIMVGGFLGAGKTTLLYEITRKLMSEGKKIGLITNDQASELVDTTFLLQTQAKVGEVSGSCFCCNYNGFIDSLKKVKEESDADILIAEPVGSCTDLSATIMQPLKEQLNKELKVSPLSVLADPIRLADILDGRQAGLHPSAVYIFEKQLEESDIILISKTDLLEDSELEFLKEKVKLKYPESEVMSVSSKTGEGFAEWLEKVLTGTQAGQRIVDVDYDIYAEGEAVLGWLNASLKLAGKQVEWDWFVEKFLKSLGESIDKKQIGTGHIKVILENGIQYVTGNITGRTNTLNISGKSGVSDKAQMIINARVGTDPETLEKIVKVILENLSSDKIKIITDAWRCLSPSYPRPTHRYNHIVD